jgi:hypothetical protein
VFESVHKPAVATGQRAILLSQGQFQQQSLGCQFESTCFTVMNLATSERVNTYIAVFVTVQVVPPK